jgi:hypothetical protein
MFLRLTLARSESRVFYALLKKPQPRHWSYVFQIPWARRVAGPAVTAGTIR